MLEASFAPDLGTILAKLPSEGRQTLLFSATMTRSIQKLQELSSRPVFAFESKSDAEFELVERLEQHVRIGIHANRLEITTSSHCSLVSSLLTTVHVYSASRQGMLPGLPAAAAD